MDLRQLFNIDNTEKRLLLPRDPSGPNFGAVALSLDHLEAKSSEGWWAEWWGCMYAETIIRDFGPLVASAAVACDLGDEGSSATSTTYMIRCADNYLQWEAECPSSDDDEARRLIQNARRALAALRSHLSSTAEQN